MKRTRSAFSGSVAMIITADKFSVIAAAILAHRENLLKNPNFFSGSIYIIEHEEAETIDVSEHDHVYVVGLNPDSMGKRNFKEFLYRHHGKLHYWYSRKPMKIESKVVLDSANIGVFTGGSIVDFAKTPTGGTLFEAINLVNTHLALESGDKYLRTEISETFRKSLYVAKIYDRLAKTKKCTTKKLFGELFKICIGENSSTVFNLVMDYKGEEFIEIKDLVAGYKKIKKNHRKSEEQKVQHPLLGLMSIVRPANDLVDRKMFFRNLGVYEAIAVAALDQDPNGGIFEVCLSHNKTKSMSEEDWQKIPFIKRMNGHRFFIQEEFIMHVKKTEKSELKSQPV